MPATHFLTTNDLEKAGFKRSQADALVQDRDALRAELAGLATKDDITTELRAGSAELRAEIARLPTKDDLRHETGSARTEFRWFLGFVGALNLAVLAKLFGIV